MKKKFVFLQITAWIISLALFYFYLSQRLPKAGWEYVLAITLTSFASFAILIYGYVHVLLPKFGKKTNQVTFILIVSIFYFIVSFARFLIEGLFVAPLTHYSNSFFDFDQSHFLYDLISCFFALIIGILLKSFIDNVRSQQKEAEIRRKHAEAELKLLKAQIQPHFLFNSFNNLYYDTYKELPDVAKRISMLSDIMRYFLEESTKEKVPLKKEIEFIQNYIELEKVRFSNPLNINFTVHCAETLLVPPMLLMPLVENLFKHGVQKNGKENVAAINLDCEEGSLKFSVENKLHHHPKATTGIGLKNLRERLNLLYGDKYTLDTKAENGLFHSELSIPVL